MGGRVYDLVVRGARVVDGSGRPAFTADLGIADGRIAEIGRIGPDRARRAIEADGLVATPGFIDIHSHSDYHLLLAPGADSSLRQGVTTEIGGNCGYSAAPIWGAWREERVEGYREVYGLDCPWQGVGEYFRHLEAAGLAVNFGLLLGHNTLRGSAMGGSARAARPEELEAMETAARRGMAEGALGLSTGLVYRPACFAPPGELAALAGAVREAGGLLAAHIRSEGDGLLEALEEIIGIARSARIPLQISHLKTSGEGNWAKLDSALALIEAARAEGLAVTADRYPYTAANTGLDAVLPRWALEGSRKEQVARLREPDARARLLAKLEARPAAYWGTVMIAEVTLEPHRVYQGLSVDEAAARAGQRPAVFVLDLLAAEELRVEAIYFSMSEANLRRILSREWVMIGSDSGCRSPDSPLGRGHPHPRTFGTFARVLGALAREERLFPLEVAIRKMTSDPARKLGLVDRGCLGPGLAADLVLFDPVAVRDRATYEAPWQFPEGIHAVLVNGRVAVEASTPTGVKAGGVLRRRPSGP